MSQATTIDSSPGYTFARRWPRYKVDVPIRVIVYTVAKTKIFDARGTSLSEGGMALFAGAELRPAIRWLWNSRPPIPRLPSEWMQPVCNRSGDDYGVEFLAASETQKQRIGELRRHLPTLAEIAE
jgi:hypothetical protein